MSEERPWCARRALISLSDKRGLAELAGGLAELGCELLSTGGTLQLLDEHGIAATAVSEHTGFPEIMGGRVKTMHPKIVGGILGRRGIDDEVMSANDIAPIDLVVVNLYPFAATAARTDATPEAVVEQIDIGGPSLLRAAAKNHRDVAVVVEPDDYGAILEALRTGGLDQAMRQRLAIRAFAHTAAYDQAIATWMAEREPTADEWPTREPLRLRFKASLRYGENPQQRAALYVDDDSTAQQASAATAQQLQGKELSFNNIADADTALECVRSLQGPACVIVKHSNPCGAALRQRPAAAFEAALSSDAESAFGGIIALNRPLDIDTAQAVLNGPFAELLIAPSVDQRALALLAARPALRVLACGELGSNHSQALHGQRIRAGLLVQQRDRAGPPASDWRCVSARQASAAELADLEFAWIICQFVKSNAIVCAGGGLTLGIGAGQTSRVFSVRIAALRAAESNHSLDGAVLASDAFFPFADGVEVAAEANIRCVVQPGGSRRDDEVIAAADRLGLTMLFTGQRHFRH